VLCSRFDSAYMYSELGNDQQTAMQLIFQYSPNPSVFSTTPKVRGMGLNLTAGDNGGKTQMFYVLNMQCQECAQVVRLWQKSITHTALLKSGPNIKHNRVGDLHQCSGVGQTSVLNHPMSRPNITMSTIYRIQQYCEHHMMRLMGQRDVTPSCVQNEL
jgi:hypothetical protein